MKSNLFSSKKISSKKSGIRNLIGFFMVVTLASLASAQSARQAPHDFASAMALYNQSSLPTQKTVSGVFAGTCYWSPAEEAILKSYLNIPIPLAPG